jgi:CheY-like chemotaxis protein
MDKNRQILVIEDNPSNLYLMQYLLGKHGYTAIEADTGLKGIELAMTSKPLAIILDIQLPEMDGYEVAKAIREYSSLDDTPIIAVTSYAMIGDRENAIAAGASAYIEKPINPDTFIKEIESHIQEYSERSKLCES